MREISFRGKDIKTGEWVCGYLSAENFITFPVPDSDPASNIILMQTVEIDPATVGQYTGLKDRNGKKIFEGDIVCLHFGATHPMIAFYDGLGFKFRYSTGGMKTGCWDSDIIHDVCLCEIIGNIYDNPELLEVKL